MKPIPVILDTDIGSDIDDTWALAMLLRCPELDLRLVVTDTDDTEYRARIVAKMLEIAGRADIPVGVGVPFPTGRPDSQAAWVEDYDLGSYAGRVVQDGVGALIDCIMGSPEPVTLICIGPVPNIAQALEREPRIVERARFIGMHGSVYKGYGGSAEISAEYNVKRDARSCARALSADWDVTITPLDTCGLVTLEGARYRRIRTSSDPLLQALMENYGVWLDCQNRRAELDVRSSTLYDTVAVYLAFSEALLEMADVPVRVTDDGFTVVDPAAKTLHVAVDWRDMEAFKDLLTARLLGPTNPPPPR